MKNKCQCGPVWRSYDAVKTVVANTYYSESQTISLYIS